MEDLSLDNQNPFTRENPFTTPTKFNHSPVANVVPSPQPPIGNVHSPVANLPQSPLTSSQQLPPSQLTSSGMMANPMAGGQFAALPIPESGTPGKPRPALAVVSNPSLDHVVGAGNLSPRVKPRDILLLFI